MNTMAMFLAAADCAIERLRHPALVDSWDRSSALPGYTVGGLAGHLSRAVTTVTTYVERGMRSDVAGTLSAADYFAAVLGDEDPVDSDLHRGIRERAAKAASAGPSELADSMSEAVTRLRSLRDVPMDGTVEVLNDVPITLEEYLRTRIVELAVHLDDLDASIDVSGSPLSEEAFRVAAAVLAELAVLRVGGLKTIRALARQERQSERVTAL